MKNNINLCAGSWSGEPATGECPECCDPVDYEGLSITGCYYSEIECRVCGSRPCDGSCR